MQKKVLIGIALALVIAFAATLPAVGQDYDYKRTSTGFRYIGNIFHEKEVDFDFGKASFFIRGFGEVFGNHDVHAVRYKDYLQIDDDTNNIIFGSIEEKVNISLYIRGKTDPDYATRIAQMEQEALAHIEGRREQAIAELNAKKQATPGMTGEEFAAEMRSINNYFDNLRIETIDSFSEAKGNIRILTEHILPNHDTRIRAGIDLDPGEEGFIRQSIASSTGPGVYLKVRNQIENTGGTTKRSLEIGNFLNERMRVDGYAKVYETSKVTDGKTKTGWWDTQP